MRTRIRVTATADGPRGAQGAMTDEVQESVAIAPVGYPFRVSRAGTLRAGERVELDVAIGGGRTGVRADSIAASLSVYPSPVATMLKGAEALIREPHGCFEQASSANYPNVLVLHYLRQQGIADPALVSRTRDVLARGYRKLVGYESPKRGYEWFGGDPGHEALTAYGLLEFTDMAQVFDEVEPAMLARTESWLLARRDGRGGFKRNQRALDSFGDASDAVTDAYISYALAQSARTRGPAAVRRAATEMRAEIARQRELATRTRDPYLLALAARTLNALQPDAVGKHALARLAKMQHTDGSFPGADHSVTRSGGGNLLIETTALAALALMDADARHEAEIRAAIGWLRDARSGTGAFGTTQATVLALQALAGYARHARAQAAEGGSVNVYVAGKRAGALELTPGESATASDPLVLAGVGRHLTPGGNRVTLEYRGTGAMPYALGVQYRGAAPTSGERSPVRVRTALDRARVAVGEPVALRVQVDNRSSEDIPMVLTRVGIPGGLRAQPWQLQQLRERGRVDFVETRPREVLLYWRGLPANARRTVELQLISTVPGQYTGPASQAYLYYDDENRGWAPPLSVDITRG
jgi:hypothetical protein